LKGCARLIIAAGKKANSVPTAVSMTDSRGSTSLAMVLPILPTISQF
jgi:hypothetical protein